MIKSYILKSNYEIFRSSHFLPGIWCLVCFLLMPTRDFFLFFLKFPLVKLKIGIQWYSVFGICWYLLVFRGIQWYSVVFAGIRWYSLVFVGIRLLV